MDFMNLNQSAHGETERAWLLSQPACGLKRKVIAGYWQDEAFQKKNGNLMRAAVGAAESRKPMCFVFQII